MNGDVTTQRLTLVRIDYDFINLFYEDTTYVNGSN